MKRRLPIMLLSCVLLACSPMTQKTEVGDNSSAEVHQEQDKVAGAKVMGGAEEVVTNHNSGINPIWFIGTTIFFALALPQFAPFKLLFP